MPLARPATPVTRRQAVVVWSALAGALVVATALSAAFAPAGDVGRAYARPGLLVLSLLSIGEIVGGTLVLRSMRRSGADAATQTIVACALSLGVALFAAVLHFVTRDPVFLVFVAGAAVVLGRWFPSASRWARLSGPVGGGGRKPMIRG